MFAQSGKAFFIGPIVRRPVDPLDSKFYLRHVVVIQDGLPSISASYEVRGRGEDGANR